MEGDLHLFITAINCKGLIFRKIHRDTVPTERNLTPERTQSEPGVRSLRSLLKNFRSLWVRYLGALYALMREADPIFILPPVSPTPCIFQTFTR
jgi:hypothetical protein